MEYDTGRNINEMKNKCPGFEEDNEAHIITELVFAAS